MRGPSPFFACLQRRRGGYEEIIAGGPGALSRFLSKGYPMVAVQQDQIIALGTVDIAGEIKALGVHPGMRGKKIGQKLLYSLEEKAKNADKPFVWTKKTEHSAGFFKRCGYEEREELLKRDFYQENESETDGGIWGA